MMNTSNPDKEMTPISNKTNGDNRAHIFFEGIL